MKECLNCKKEFEPKKQHGKFCCANCRVSYNRKHPKIENGINAVVSPTMQELFNSIMAGIDAINARNGLPPAICSVIVPEKQKEAVLSYNELMDLIESATSSTELHKAWKAVEKNKTLAGWQIRELEKLKNIQQTKIDF